jgi:2-polyprenyl-3-methyl-5-hydroxy-6-metoxy-1,4-benzoquinol methylase
MIDLTTQPCPVCGQLQSELVHQTTYPEHHYPGTFVMRRCCGCGLLFNSPRLDLDALGKLYGSNYYFFLRKDEREFDRIVAMYQRTIGLIESQISTKRSIDIGTGRGYFPAVLRELGWDAAGIEISADATKYAREKFGLDVFTGTVEQYAASPSAKQFPLVTAIDVIEHVPSPDTFVAAAAKIVESGGRLIIDTPNALAANIRNKGVAWKGFNPFHIYLFSIDNLTQLLTRHGMTVEQSFSYGNAPDDVDARDKVIGGLKKAHLLSPAVSAYFAMKKLTVRSGDPQPHVQRAESRIRNEPAYTSTPDSTDLLAKDKAGDNIVVVARKG